jgi:DNA-binding response OmpR family regulator
MARILIVEDDKAILMGFKDDLEFEGFEVVTAEDGQVGLARALRGDCDLVILDVLLPGLNGFEVVKRLRGAGIATPILMLTAARTEEVDKVVGLELGADDYVTKPVGSRELVARAKAIMRRTKRAGNNDEVFSFGDVEVRFKSREVLKAGRPLSLTALEFKLLKFFIDHPGEVLSRDRILDEAWGDAVVAYRTVDPHIAHLRKKIEDDPAHPEHIISVRSVGYKFLG